MWVCAFVTALVVADSAYAHKLKLFATGDGATISGYAYFPGGGRARGLMVVASAADGSELGSAVTNDRGEFTLPARFHCDHTLVAETVDGHRATYVVEALELSADLPAFGGEAAQASGSSTSEDMDIPPTGGAAGEAPAPALGYLSDLVEQAVREQVRPLREQLEGYEERTRMRDVLGGLGYIAGITGLVFYVLGVRRREVVRNRDGKD
jgi:nickel transport protein